MLRSQPTSCQNRIRFLAAPLFALLALLAGPALADWQEEATLQIPFRFVLDDTTLPEGEYTFYSHLAEPNVLRVERTDGDAGVVTLTQQLSDEELEEAAGPRLVFEILRGRRFLEEAHFPTSGHHWQIDKGRDYLELLATGESSTRQELSTQGSD